VVLRSGLQVDLRIVTKRSYGAALLYFTGSRAHTLALRRLGQDRNFKVNEYGIFDGKRRLASKTESAMYRSLGLHYIEPELREARSELEASRKNRLPRLVTLEDIRGDLQSHTKASDGKYSLREMAGAARDMGYEYFAVTDHSKRVSMAGGLEEKRTLEHIRQIDRLNKEMEGIRILKSMEVDILGDGTLDLPEREQTARIIRAMDNPRFHILAHPTDRIFGKRKACEMDLEKIMRHAVKRGCFMEINATPDRLDLKDDHIRMARELGLKLSISTDVHSLDHLQNMKFGVDQARRGWLEKKDVLNTRPWNELIELLRRE